MAGVTETPDGFNSSLRFDCTTAESDVAAAEYWFLSQRFEGQDLQSWKKGSAAAMAVTLSFWVNATKIGTYIAMLYDSDNTRHISKAYTVDTTNTWEYKTITFEGDTDSNFNNDNARSCDVWWFLMAGSNFTSGTLATSWASYTGANNAVGQVNTFDNTNNYYHITGVQLELGSTATAFQYETKGENLWRCQRYYAQRAATNAILYNSSTAGSAGQYEYSHWQFKTTMRAAPTMTGHGGGSSGNNQQQINVDSGGSYAAAGTYATWGNDSTADAELS
jgi:hypothetical protein